MPRELSIYFAGAIRGGRDDQALYLAIIELLGNYGRVLTEHIGDAQLDAHGESATFQQRPREMTGLRVLRTFPEHRILFWATISCAVTTA